MEQKESYSLSGLITESRIFLALLLRKWLLLLVAILVGAGLGFALYQFQKPKYKAVTSFILEEKSVGGGGLAGLASQFGFNIGSLSGGESIFTGDNILNILQSKKVVQDVLLTRMEGKDSLTLADSYLEFSGLTSKWKRKVPLAAIRFAAVKLPLSPLEDSVLNVVYERIIKNNLLAEKTSRQGTIYRVQITAGDNEFARILSERLVVEASKLYLDLRVGTAQKNISELQRRSDSLLMLLNNKSYVAASSQPLDINPGIRTAVVPMEIASRDKTVLATLYAEVTKNLEASKMLLSQETPVIQLLDRPQYLLDDNKSSIWFFIVVCCVGAEVVLVMALFLIFLLNKEDKEMKQAAKSIVKQPSNVVPEYFPEG